MSCHDKSSMCFVYVGADGWLSCPSASLGKIEYIFLSCVCICKLISGEMPGKPFKTDSAKDYKKNQQTYL